MTRYRIGPLLVAAGLLAPVARLHAQPLTGALGLSGEGLWRRSASSGAAAWMRGPAVRGEATLAWGPFVAGAYLLEGALTAPVGGSHLDVVEGAVSAGISPWPWLEVGAARRVRAYVTDSATQRWSTWQARLRVGGAVLGPALTSYAEAWWGFAVQGSPSAPAGNPRGGEAGLILSPAGPVSLTLAYHIDQLAAGGGATALGPLVFGAAGSRETVEALELGAVVHFR